MKLAILGPGDAALNRHSLSTKKQYWDDVTITLLLPTRHRYRLTQFGGSSELLDGLVGEGAAEGSEDVAQVEGFVCKEQERGSGYPLPSTLLWSSWPSAKVKSYALC